MNKIKHLLSQLILIIISLNLLSENPEDFYTFNDDHVKLTKEVIGILETQHFTKKSYISLKEESLYSYFERLDPNRTIFLASEIERFVKQQQSLRKENHAEELNRAFEIFDLYRKRYEKRYNYQKEILETAKDSDLKQDRKILKDRSESNWPNQIELLYQLWQDIILNDVIQLNLNGNELKETKEKLLKRLANQYHFFKQTKSEDIVDLYINSIALTYGPHTSYMSPKRMEDFEIDMRLSLEGIGALLSSDGLYTTIASLVPGGPAEKADKLKPKDKIIGVAQEGEDDITDVIGWRIDDVVQLIRGPKNTNVRLEIIPSSSVDESETKIIEITRNVVKLEDQAAEEKIINVKKDSLEYKVGVISLPAFYMDFEAFSRREYDFRSSSKDVKKLIISLKEKNIDGLILDLRNNGGGSLFEANALAHLFLGGGIKVQVKSSNGNIQGIGDRRGFQFYDGPLVILVNKFSASASEILAGAIQDYERGLVLGSDTFGKGTVQRVQELSIGQLKFTESKFYRVSGKSTQNKGISPDIILPSPINESEYGESTLPKALGYDVISKTKTRNFNRVPFSKQIFTKDHKDRVDTSVIFNHYKTLNSWRKNQENEKFVELDIDKRRLKKERIETDMLSMENNLRKTLGLNTFNTYKDFLDKDEDDKKPDIDEEILYEAANILTDFIDYSFKPIVTMNQNRKDA
ncbi:MAG: carboxy terminal-processing peptidase [Gammaproteobacteria bacterium]